MMRGPGTSDRTKEIARLVAESDLKYREIGERFGITRQAVHQIAKRTGAVVYRRYRVLLQRKRELEQESPQVRALLKSIGMLTEEEKDQNRGEIIRWPTDSCS